MKTLLCMALLFVATVAQALTSTAQTPTSQKPAIKSITPVGVIEKVHTGFAFTEGPAWDPSGMMYFTDIPATTIHTIAEDNALSAFTKDSKHANGLMVAADGRLLACQMDGQVVAYNVADGTLKVLANQYNGTRFNAPNDLVIDEGGGIYFTDPEFSSPKPLPQVIQAVYYIATSGTVTRVTDGIAAPNGIALSPDGKKLYVAPSHSPEMLVYDVESAGTLSNRRVLCRLTQPTGKDGTGGDGMAIDVEGNLYFTTNLGVEIFSPAGEKLGLVVFPEQPANVAFGGKERKTMYATARTSIYRVQMPIAGLKPN